MILKTILGLATLFIFAALAAFLAFPVYLIISAGFGPFLFLLWPIIYLSYKVGDFLIKE